ncbi:DUF2848 domain-containing protein [Allokutzneria sp. A3M-2-11 16]|uniref:DUF2848 domain-containing protein n=1 Tax=Allokutzneria sp. A3M-2-11 16 TaxID=2962043 RepID=UPI0020B65DAC|nr:DUF2848 domain-containing protein [Allokutzneria sp. A3M-2-11 16]MCP3797712.1 DUF2848 domain-containing protein [Allokutzneria sp. A3M-2-11 16]
MTELVFELPDGSQVPVAVKYLLNGGYAGRSQEDVAAHVAELADLGVPAPSTTPCLYPVAPYLAQQATSVPVQHGKTSGEAEWALIVTEDDVLLTVACDHTDRDLEVHGVAWSKQAAPDVLGTRAWRLSDVEARLDELTLTAWADDEIIQRGTLAELLPPSYWLAELKARGLFEPGTILLSGTIPMLPGVNQFARSWRVELADPTSSERPLTLSYTTSPLPTPVG